MRLIDADKLALRLNDYALQESPSDTESAGERRTSKEIYNTIKNCINAVNEQPTAYDVNKTVKELDEKTFLVATSKEFYDNLQNGECVENVVSLADAIKIVRGEVE